MSEPRDRARAWHASIRHLLIEEWDPIGVRDEPLAQDEYDAYVPRLYRLLVTRRPRHEVVDYLWWAETEHMGLCGNRQATEAVADLLLELANKL